MSHFSDPRRQWDAFISRLRDAVGSPRQPEGGFQRALAEYAATQMAPMARLMAQALLIRLDKSAEGRPLSLTLLERHVSLSRHALGLLAASSAESQEPRVRLFLSRVTSGAVRTRADLTDTARDMSLSVPYLSRLVYSDTRVSVQRHIDGRRLLDAAHLLSRTFLGVDEIAAKLGYEHAHDLDRCFSRNLGVHPTELRAFFLKEACRVGSSRVDLQACKLEYSIVSPK